MTVWESDPSPGLQKALELAMKILLHQPRTKQYIRDYLEKKQYEEAVIVQVITYLQEKNYINDLEYAQWFIDSRIRNNPKSCRALFYELRQKGIAPEICGPLLEELDDQYLAFAAIEGKIESWQKYHDREKCKKKLFSCLSCRGFGFQEIQTVWDEVSREM